MPAAASRDELLAVTNREYAKLTALLDGIPDAVALAPDDDDTSIKDVVAHRAHWIGLFLGWYRDGLAGREVHLPAEGYKWNELPRYNADLRARQRDLGWPEARAQLDEANRRLVALLEAATDDDLYGGPMAGGNNHWPPGRWAESAGPSHFRSAAKYVRARLRAIG